MDTKRCFKCLCVKPLAEFYAHPKMADGRLNKCKECTKRDVLAYRAANAERVRSYDKARASMPHRVASRKAYLQTAAGKDAHRRALVNSARRHPDRRAARQALNNALRDGAVVRWPCEVCGSAKTEGHHPDYSRPLLVVWLCGHHHRAAHAASTQQQQQF